MLYPSLCNGISVSQGMEGEIMDIASELQVFSGNLYRQKQCMYVRLKVKRCFSISTVVSTSLCNVSFCSLENAKIWVGRRCEGKKKMVLSVRIQFLQYFVFVLGFSSAL